MLRPLFQRALKILAPSSLLANWRTRSTHPTVNIRRISAPTRYSEPSNQLLASLFRHFVIELSSCSIYLIDHLLDDPRILKFLILPPELERSQGILDAIVCFALNVLLEQIPRQEPQAQVSLGSSRVVEQCDCVNDLGFGHEDIDVAKVFDQPYLGLSISLPSQGRVGNKSDEKMFKGTVASGIAHRDPRICSPSSATAKASYTRPSTGLEDGLIQLDQDHQR